MQISFKEYGSKHPVTVWVDHIPAASFDLKTGEIVQINQHQSNPMHCKEVRQIVIGAFNKWLDGASVAC